MKRLTSALISAFEEIQTPSSWIFYQTKNQNEDAESKTAENQTTKYRRKSSNLVRKAARAIAFSKSAIDEQADSSRLKVTSVKLIWRMKRLRSRNQIIKEMQKPSNEKQHEEVESKTTCFFTWVSGIRLGWPFQAQSKKKKMLSTQGIPNRSPM